jgi:hypothetical protein
MDGITFPERQFESEAFPPEPTPERSSGSFIKEIHGVVTDEECLDLELDEEWQVEDPEYFAALKGVELEYMTNPYSLQTMQPNIKPIMRAVLLDWMMEVSAEFGLKRETFHLAVWYVDRFLSLQSCVKKEDFQLVGLVAMFIAAKAEVPST